MKDFKISREAIEEIYRQETRQRLWQAAERAHELRMESRGW